MLDLACDVLVVGTGPSGLILALCLVMSGVSVRIIDKEPSYRVGRRGAGITPRTLEVFKILGVLLEILELAHKPVKFQSYELPDGIKPLKTWTMSPTLEPTPARPFLNAVFLGQDQVEGILRERLEAYACFVELGTELLGFQQYEDHVAVHISVDSAGSHTEDINVKYLVGADGAKGIVRKQLGLSFLGETRTEDCLIVSDVIVDGLDLEKVLSDPEEFRQFFRSQTGRKDIKLMDIVWISEYIPNIRMVDELERDRVFIVGDAAHGMNSSVQDSFNVGWKLACATLGLASPGILSTYAEERLPVIAIPLRDSSVIAAMLEKTTELHRKTKSFNQLGINYRWSSIVLQETPRGTLDVYGNDSEEPAVLVAGDRAPDAPGLLAEGNTVPQTLFDIFKYTAHTVLVFCPLAERSTICGVVGFMSGLPQRVQSVVIHPSNSPGIEVLEPQADFVVWDQDGHAFSAYCASVDQIYCIVVRPDGMVGAIVSGVVGLTKYFDNIFQRRV
ncbi:hypothetical protein B0H17DRAFT_1158237 [Mycena rosella]|uniref:FAD-binding domain-containing protein n=1 Tax=Mycena rosella TaxID=1033263 RepID=A0AAD7GKG6_MYCRO|nr:hypothetical protein B0H17DRAFT_1158237 [Mycena rosella]